MDMTIKFNMDNDAFLFPERETKRILDKVIYQMDIENREYGSIQDINGNKIGYWEIKNI